VIDNAELALLKMMHPADAAAFREGRVSQDDIKRLKVMYNKEIRHAFQDAESDGETLVDEVAAALDSMYYSQG